MHFSGWFINYCYNSHVYWYSWSILWWLFYYPRSMQNRVTPSSEISCSRYNSNQSYSIKRKQSRCFVLYIFSYCRANQSSQYVVSYSRCWWYTLSPSRTVQTESQSNSRPTCSTSGKFLFHRVDAVYLNESFLASPCSFRRWIIERFCTGSCSRPTIENIADSLWKESSIIRCSTMKFLPILYIYILF